MDSSRGWFAGLWANETEPFGLTGQPAALDAALSQRLPRPRGFPASGFPALVRQASFGAYRGGCGRRRGVPQRILARARDHILRRNQRARLRKRPTVFHGEARSRISEPPCCSRCVIFLAFRGRSIAWRSPARQGGNRFSARRRKRARGILPEVGLPNRHRGFFRTMRNRGKPANDGERHSGIIQCADDGLVARDLHDGEIDRRDPMAREIAPFDAAQQVAFTSRTNWETERGPAATRKSVRRTVPADHPRQFSKILN